MDEAYGYDTLYQLTGLTRGSLNATPPPPIGGTPKWQETFSFDETGNWPTYQTAINGNSTLQTRAHNKANEITGINGSSATVAYDGAGNMTTMPKVGAGTGQTLKWDAWNRLVKITEGTTTPVTIGDYRYDGLTRRISKQSAEGGVSTLRHFYYSAEWQVLEERVGTQTTPERQFIWGLRYLDDLVLRDRRPGATSSSSSSSSSGSSGTASLLTERLYATHDQWHVTGLLSSSGTVLERYAYKAYGESIVLTATYASRSVSLFDWETRFGAYRFDAESKLYCVRYRYLHPGLGRWVSRDPYISQADWNAFDFTRNAPPNAADVLGLEPVPGTYTPEQLMKMLFPEGPPPGAEREIRRGCIGLTSVVQHCSNVPSGYEPTPEWAPGTECYLSRLTAEARKCKLGEKNFVFGKFGDWEKGKPPTVRPDGTVDPNSIKHRGGHYNYVTCFYTSSGTLYGWINSATNFSSQQCTIQPGEPTFPNQYPHVIWCSTCKCRAKTSTGAGGPGAPGQ